jgi:hypothetical protein
MAPILIEESTVGLYTVSDALVKGLMLALYLHNVAKVVQPQDGWFPTMPGKVNHRTGGSVDVLDNVLLQDRVGHAKRLALRIEVFLLQVVTIVTVQVADRANGLDKNLKFTRGFDHCSIPNLQAEPQKALDRNVPRPVKSGRRCVTGNIYHDITPIERKAMPSLKYFPLNPPEGVKE